MTHIEQAIEEAVQKGGYIFDYEKHEIDKGGSDAVPTAQILLDLSFWQALGKARGWGDHKLQSEIENRCWKCRWHRFIDHLAEGKDAESFFASVLK